MKTKSAEEILNEAAQRKTFFVFRQALIDIRFRYSDVEKMVYEAMESYAAQFKPKWIACSEALPNERGNYLCFDPNSPLKDKVEIFRFDTYNKCWFGFGTAETYHPTQWMELPQLPNENKEE